MGPQPTRTVSPSWYRRRPGDHSTAFVRFLGALGTGVVGAAILGLFRSWVLSLLAFWFLTAVAFAAWTVAEVAPLDADSTRRLATTEDPSRAATYAMVVTASVVSIGGVTFALVDAKDADSPLNVLLTIGAIATVTASWFLVHIVFMLRYAALYHQGTGDGVDFNQDDEPDYWDFAYLAFTVGMTFQVSDTDITRRAMRRTVLRHMLVSYLFGAVIVAITVNVIGGLLH